MGCGTQDIITDEEWMRTTNEQERLYTAHTKQKFLPLYSLALLPVVVVLTVVVNFFFGILIVIVPLAGVGVFLLKTAMLMEDGQAVVKRLNADIYGGALLYLMCKEPDQGSVRYEMAIDMQRLRQYKGVADEEVWLYVCRHHATKIV